MYVSLEQADIHYVTASGEMATRRETLFDGRQALAHQDFVTTGFTLQRHISAVTNWSDDDAIDQHHRPEIYNLAKQFSHCDEVVVYPGLRRGPRHTVSHDDHLPIQMAHSDFTDDYRSMVLNPARPYAQFLKPLLKEASLSYQQLNAAKRLLVLQFWRNTGPVNPDYPLAITDASSVPYQNLRRETVETYGDETLAIETFLVTPPNDKDYRWFTFSDLNHDEVIIFRTYDSDLEVAGLPFWTPHSAFLNSDPDAINRPRESLEMRALCLFF